VQVPHDPPTQGPGKPTTTTGDTWELLDKDTHAVSGAHLGDWNSATNHRIEGDEFVADNPTAGGTLRLPVPVYQKFLDRFNALQNGTPAALPGNPPPGPPVTPSSGIDTAAAFSQARAKIQAGADPALVRQRLQKLGLDPSQL
jgi:hypothetical protein